jgi:hypothetical protein
LLLALPTLQKCSHTVQYHHATVKTAPVVPFSMGEDVHLLTKNMAWNRVFDAPSDPVIANSSVTPKMPSDLIANDSRRRNEHSKGHSRWNSVSTIYLGSLFGLSSRTDDSINEAPSNSRKRPKRVRIKGMYGFFLQKSFSVEVSIECFHCMRTCLLKMLLLYISILRRGSLFSPDILSW